MSYCLTSRSSQVKLAIWLDFNAKCHGCMSGWVISDSNNITKYLIQLLEVSFLIEEQIPRK